MYIVSFLADRYLCIASGRHVSIYSVASGEKVHFLKEHKSQIIGLAIKNDDILYSCDSSGSVIEWDFKTGTMLEV